MASQRPDGSETIRLTPTNPDPVASLEIWGATVTLGGVDYWVPPLDAARWLRILLAEDLDLEALFPGLAGPDVVAQVNLALARGDVDDVELVQAIKDLVEQVSGRKWWIALRLCRSVRASWERVGGQLARHGVHPAGMPLSWWLDAAYETCIDLIAASDPRKLTRFTQSLVLPPPGEDDREVDEVAQGNAFLALFRQQGGTMQGQGAV